MQVQIQVKDCALLKGAVRCGEVLWCIYILVEVPTIINEYCFLLTGLSDTYPSRRLLRLILRISTHPISPQIIYNTCEGGVSPLWHCDILQRDYKIWFKCANCCEEKNKKNT